MDPDNTNNPSADTITTNDPLQSNTTLAAVSTPRFNPKPGSYASWVRVSIVTLTPRATIRYTVDGTEPVSDSPRYSGPITLKTSTLLKAKAYRAGMKESATAIASYTISSPLTVADPVINPNGGTFTEAQTVTISSATSGATVRYTTDGSEPSSTSPAYTGAITISATTTVKAKAFKDGMKDSATVSAVFNINSPGINVVQYGAKLDGVTDDTAAIQKAINAAGNGDTVYIPYTAKGFALNGTINLKSGITIDGSNSTAYITPAASGKNTFRVASSIDNVTVKKLKFISSNQYSRTEDGRSGLCSNVYLFHFYSYTNFTLEDIYAENAEYLFKCDSKSSGLTMRNIETKGVYQPFYCVSNSNVTGENIMFDCPTTGETLDHGFYINGGSQNMSFNNVTLKNGSGQCFKVSNSDLVSGACRDINVTDLKMYNVHSGIFVVGGDHYNINFKNVSGDTMRTRGQYWLNTGYCESGRVIQNITLENFQFKNNAGGLYMNDFTNNGVTTGVRILHGTVDGRCGSLPVSLGSGGVEGLYLEDVTFTDALPTYGGSIIKDESDAAKYGIEVNNCTFIYNSAACENIPLNFSSSAAKSTNIHNSRFINKMSDYSAGLTYSGGGGTSYFKDNEFYGFERVTWKSDTLTVANNNYDLKNLIMV